MKAVKNKELIKWIQLCQKCGIEVNLSEAYLIRANLIRANLLGANLLEANLLGANLRRANLLEANLSGANLSGANLGGANLWGANLEEANLWGANLWGANLSGANLSGANLGGANLWGANLEEANLGGANLWGANLEEANLWGANLWGANLSGVKGLFNPSHWLKENFEKTAAGYLVYKRISSKIFKTPDHWVIEPNSIIEEVPNPDPWTTCGSGVNFGTLEYCKKHCVESTLWKCLLMWEDLPRVVVPVNSDGKCRCARLKLLMVV